MRAAAARGGWQPGGGSEPFAGKARVQIPNLCQQRRSAPQKSPRRDHRACCFCSPELVTLTASCISISGQRYQSPSLRESAGYSPRPAPPWPPRADLAVGQIGPAMARSQIRGLRSASPKSSRPESRAPCPGLLTASRLCRLSRYESAGGAVRKGRLFRRCRTSPAESQFGFSGQDHRRTGTDAG